MAVLTAPRRAAAELLLLVDVVSERAPLVSAGALGAILAMMVVIR